MLACPNCSRALLRETTSYVCPQGHRFDVAREGYVNLLVSSSSKIHGDEVSMVTARRTFLTQGHYQPLIEAVLSCINSLQISSLVDLGCGEGTYTNRIAQAGIQVIGIDLSKAALKRAAKAACATYVIANLTQTPLLDRSVDAALSIFSPFDAQEVLRISKRWFIVVRPQTDHLDELKAILYASVRPNPEPSVNLLGFTHYSRTDVRFSMDLDHEALNALLDMTPYVHTSPQAGIQRCRALTHLHVRASFVVDVFESCIPSSIKL